MFVGIENTPRDYAWGRPGAISDLLGHAATDAVEAELWLGAHHGSPSRVRGEPTTLGAVAPDLPFLLKVLAAGAPLSIQAHPDTALAREGFERENAAGIPVDAPHRNYRDPHAKPELIVAVSTRFEALAGFRPAAESARDVAAIAAAADSVAAVAPLLERLVDDALVGDALLWLLGGGAEAGAALDAIERGLAAQPGLASHVARIATIHPGDPGVAAAILLHRVVLAAGEALYLPAGNVHAYLDGVGIELMRASDNVLRGGLTRKHVDTDELARAIDRAAAPPPRLLPSPLPGGGVLYAPGDGAGFSLARTDAQLRLPLDGPAVALCTDGEFELRGSLGSIRIRRGEAVLMTADERELHADGGGALYVAR